MLHQIQDTPSFKRITARKPEGACTFWINTSGMDVEAVRNNITFSMNRPFYNVIYALLIY